MEKDIEITPVIFRKFSDGEVIALFPTVCGTSWYDCNSYMHVGQHSSADLGIVSITKLAKEEEYKDLFEELESIGYNLKVYTRFNKWMNTERRNEYFDKYNI